MKGTLSVLCAGLALGWVAVAGAQGYGQPGTSDQSNARSRKSSEVKLVGCLAQGSTADAFVLNNAVDETGKTAKSGSNMGEQTGTAGTSGQTDQTKMSFDLVSGGRRIDLKKYVGQKVEIRGTVEPEGGAGMSNPGMSGETGTSGQSGSMSGSQSSTGTAAHTVRVTSVKQLSSSCE